MPVDPAVAALAKVRAYCRWIIAPATDETITLDGPGSTLLALPSLRVNSIASITEDGTTLTTDDFTWTADGILRRKTSSQWTRQWTDTPRSIVVTLNHGYAAMPDDVQEVVERLAARGGADAGAVRQVGQVAYAVTSQGVGVGGALTDYDKAQLAPYRIPLAP